MQLFIWLQYILPQHGLSRLVAKLADCKRNWLKNFLINRFIKYYDIDLSIAQSANVNDYESFNAFFTRELKAGARAIAGTQIISPVDGTISQLGNVNEDKIIQAKNHQYTLQALLAEKSMVNNFLNGKFMTIYLSPKDYHRVHIPIDGKLLKTIYIPGKLFSVNPQTVNHVPDIFARNERLVCLFDTALGKMAVIMVGAMLVAGIHTVWAGDVQSQGSIKVDDYTQQNIHLTRAQEMGYFKFGSTVIVLLPESEIEWQQELSAASTLIMGQALSQL